MFVKGLEKTMILLSRAWTKILGTLFVKGLERTWDFFDKGLEINLRTGFRHESRQKREPFSSRGTFYVKGLENIWEFFAKGLRTSSELLS